MQITKSTITTTASLRRRAVRFAAVALAATTAIGVPGTSAHADGVVDQADFHVWVEQYGQTTEADVNADGVVDAADFVVWREHSAAHDPDGWVIIQSMSRPIFQ